MALLDAPPGLAQDVGGAPAARLAAYKRDHAERTREAAAVLDLDEGANALQPSVRPDAADRANVAGHEVRRSLATARDHDDVLRQAGEAVGREVGPAACDVDAPVRAGGSPGRVARLADSLVRDAAGVYDRDVRSVGALRVAIREQALADRLRVGVRDFAAQEAHRETRHGAGLYSSRRKRSAAQPSEMRLSAARKPAGAGRSDSR